MARRLKIISGLILFVFVTVHLVNLAIGFFSLPLADQLRPVLLFPFSNPVGGNILIASALLHMMLGVQALYKRNTLRMTAHDTVQLVSALLIPVLLIPHSWVLIANNLMLGIRVSYFDIFNYYWVIEPLSGLRQVLLVLVIWIHGCIGLFTWLGLKPWWPRVSSYTHILAVAIPVLALLAFVDGGKRAILENSEDPGRGYNASVKSNEQSDSGESGDYNGSKESSSASDPYSDSNSQPDQKKSNDYGSYEQSDSQSNAPAKTGYGQSYRDETSTEEPPKTQPTNDKRGPPRETDPVKIKEIRTFIDMVKWRFIIGYIALILIVLGARAIRVRNTGQMVEVHYASGKVLKRPAGLNLLEIANLNDIPHANLCRGRGRCGTCRIRIINSSTDLDPPTDLERQTLSRTGSDDDVRLACQLTPGPGVISIERLLPPNIQPHELHKVTNTTDTDSPATVTENP